MNLERIARARCFGGWQETWEHPSQVLSCPMRFGLYLPPQAAHGPVPVLLFLSGLTCTHDNFVVKAGAQRGAAARGLALLVPDTSPRGPLVPDDPAWDLGQGAGFYLDATQPPWSVHYRMHSYITQELPALATRFPLDLDRVGLCGHSMGGLGALLTAFRHPHRYRSLSAFAPIAAPSRVPWGHKAYTAYLGPDRATWAAWDPSLLAATTAWRAPILVDQGADDAFLADQLQPWHLADACAQADIPLRLRQHEGYDHGYHFVATFIDDHLDHHAAALCG